MAVDLQKPDPRARDQRRPRARRRRALLVTAGALATAVAVAGTADLLLERFAGHRIAEAASCKLRPTGPVSASLTGALAGLRLLTGELGTVHISAEDVRRDGTSMSVAADLHDVTIRGAMSGGTATATIGYDQLRKRLGGAAAGLRPGHDDRGLTLTGTFAGLPLPVTVHTRTTTTADSVTVTPTSVSVLGQEIPVDRLETVRGGASLASRLGPRTVTVPGLPSGARLTGAHAGPGGLDVKVALPRSSGGSSSNGCAA
ncbi:MULTISPECIES: LmeA family phospholipid-binding protein [unclassified Streptomyces]|uniref:LmeA family phospholipid-binding protein n=1 Tax=unclassified Streptomyces TaxID=2593676 RepID=UPI002E2B9972|nr:DUF2993 domain-containing protein [Streptomyces sp. NBC_00223]